MHEPVITSFDIEDRYIKPVPVVRMQEKAARPGPAVAEKAKASFSVRYVVPGAAVTTIILLLLGSAILKLTDPETLPIRNVGVAGEFTRLSPERLQERVGDVVRGGFFSVNVEKIQQTLLEEPWISDVAVKRVWPDRIIVTIREQVAIAQWGTDGLLNSEGNIFLPERSSFPSGLPVLQGPENSSHNVLEMFDRIKNLLPQGMGLRQLILSDRRSWELVLDTGTIIRLGKSDVIPKLEKFLDYVATGSLNNLMEIEYIDMRYTNGFAVMRKSDNKAVPEPGQENHGKEI